MSENDKIFEELRQVPAVRLRLIDLAWEVWGDGALDVQKMQLHAEELLIAEGEAQAYIKETREAVWLLKKLGHSRS